MLQLQAQMSVSNRVNFMQINALPDNVATVVVYQSGYMAPFDGKYFDGQSVIIKSFHGVMFQKYKTKGRAMPPANSSAPIMFFMLRPLRQAMQQTSSSAPRVRSCAGMRDWVP